MYKPMEVDHVNTLELINELSIMALCYLLPYFTDLIPDAQAKYNVGWLVCFFAVFVTFINFLVIVTSSLCSYYI